MNEHMLNTSGTEGILLDLNTSSSDPMDFFCDLSTEGTILDHNTSSDLLYLLDFGDIEESDTEEIHESSYIATPLPTKGDFLPTNVSNQVLNPVTPVDTKSREYFSTSSHEMSNMSMDSTLSLSSVSDDRARRKSRSIDPNLSVFFSPKENGMSCSRCDDIQHLLELEQVKTQELEADVLNLGLHSNQIDQDSQLYQTQYIQLYDRFQVKCLQLIALRNMLEGKKIYHTPESLTESIQEDLNYSEIVDSACKILEQHYSTNGSTSDTNDGQYLNHSLFISHLTKLIRELVYFRSSSRTKNTLKNNLVHQLDDTKNQLQEMTATVKKLKEENAKLISDKTDVETKVLQIQKENSKRVQQLQRVNSKLRSNDNKYLSKRTTERVSIDRISRLVKKTSTVMQDSEKVITKLKILRDYFVSLDDEDVENDEDVETSDETVEDVETSDETVQTRENPFLTFF